MPKRAAFRPTRAGTAKLPWRVNVPAGLSESGRRERRFFSTKRDAETFAEQQQIRIRNFGAAGSELTPAQRESAAAAFRLLGEVSPTKLVEIVEQHVTRVERSAASVTLKELEEEFTISKKTRSPSYLRQVKQAFTKLKALSEMKVVEITGGDLDQGLRGLAATNRNLLLRVLRAAFNYAVKKGWARENPVSSLDFVPERTGEVEVLTNRQVLKLLAACRRYDPELLPYHLFALFAGIRPEELLRMRWGHVHVEERHIVLPAEATKTSKRRVIEIEPNLADWLMEWGKGRNLAPNDPVTSRKNLRKRLRAIRRRCGLDKWIQDIMRHTYASNWLAKHGDIDRLLLNLGHYSSNVLWAHYHKAVLRKDAERFWALAPKRPLVKKASLETGRFETFKVLP